MRRLSRLPLIVSTFTAALAAQGYSTGFETLVASPAGTPMAGQDGFFVPPVAGSIDSACYTYAGNTLGIPANPNGGANFFAGNSLGGTSTARSQRAVALPGTGQVTVEFDVCCSYNGVTIPTNNLGSFSFQPSGTARFVNLLARWPVGVTFPPTTWDADFVVGPTVAGVATAFPDPNFHGLALNVWHHWVCVANLRTSEYVEFRITNGVTGKTTTFRPAPNSMPLVNAVAASPTDCRMFTGGGAGNIFAVDNLSITPQVLIPFGQAFASTATSTTAAWRSTLAHFQMVYDTSLFTAVGITGPITINRLRFRGADGQDNLGGQVYTGVTVRLSSCPLDHAAISATFASNVGADVTTVYSGAVAVGPSAGTAPNNYDIDIPLTTPFVYDPTLGLDLNIDVDAPSAPAPNATSMIAMGTSSVVATHKGRGVSTGTAAATTGTLGNAAIVLLDYTGTGGATPIGARVSPYGVGCNTAASSFYETFGGDNFDAPGGTGLTLTPSGPNYTVSAGAAPIVPPGVGPPNVSDDGVVTSPLPFTFVYPGNPAGTTSIGACTNGYVWLGASTTGDFSPTVAEFLGGGTSNFPARLAPLWHDFHAGRNTATSPTAGMYFDIDTSNPLDTVALVTWKDVGEFVGVTATGGHSVNNFQCAIHQSGVVEFRYGAMNVGATGLKITGFSRGGLGAGVNATDPGSRDLSHEIPFTTTGPDGTAVPLTLSVNVRPAITAPATVLTFTTSNIAPTALATFHVLGFIGLSPGLPIAGAPGCVQSLDLTPGFVATLLLGSPASNTFTIPSFLDYEGAHLVAQSFSFDPAANAFGMVTSNSLGLYVGLQ